MKSKAFLEAETKEIIGKKTELIKKGRSTQIIHRKETKMMSSSIPK